MKNKNKKDKQLKLLAEEVEEKVVEEEPSEVIDIDKYFAEQETIAKRKDLSKAPSARRQRVYKTES